MRPRKLSGWYLPILGGLIIPMNAATQVKLPLFNRSLHYIEGYPAGAKEKEIPCGKVYPFESHRELLIPGYHLVPFDIYPFQSVIRTDCDSISGLPMQPAFQPTGTSFPEVRYKVWRNGVSKFEKIRSEDEFSFRIEIKTHQIPDSLLPFLQFRPRYFIAILRHGCTETHILSKGELEKKEGKYVFSVKKNLFTGWTGGRVLLSVKPTLLYRRDGNELWIEPYQHQDLNLKLSFF